LLELTAVSHLELGSEAACDQGWRRSSHGRSGSVFPRSALELFVVQVGHVDRKRAAWVLVLTPLAGRQVGEAAAWNQGGPRRPRSPSGAVVRSVSGGGSASTGSVRISVSGQRGCSSSRRSPRISLAEPAAKAQGGQRRSGRQGALPSCPRVVGTPQAFDAALTPGLVLRRESPILPSAALQSRRWELAGSPSSRWQRTLPNV